MALRRATYSHLFRVTHWLLAFSLPLLVVTGLGQHAVARPGWSLFGGDYPGWLPGGRVVFCHLLAAVGFVSALIVATVEYFRRQKPRRGRRTLRGVVAAALLVGGGLSFLSALVLLYPGMPSGVYHTGRALHAACGLFLLPLALLVHVVLALGPYRRLLVPAFHPWREARWWRLTLIPLAALPVACLAGNGLPFPAARRQLWARRVSAIGEDLERLPWHEAPPLRVALINGVGFEAGRTRLTLRAFHDGRELALGVEWEDPTMDTRYLPWRKTADGWERLVTDPKDESVYYEDKLSLIFPTRPGGAFRRLGCAAYSCYGGGRSYGYKVADAIVDAWHWKATRTDPVGYADDQYWLGYDLKAEKAGRRDDPQKSGGYASNSNPEGTAPQWLPKGPGAVRQGALLREHAVPYTAQDAARLPVGSEIPGVVVAPVVGDRGDVRCQSRYQDGRWRVYLRRLLKTGSAYDLQFAPGGRYDFGCAAFDHTSKRHAYNHLVYTLVLQE